MSSTAASAAAELRLIVGPTGAGKSALAMQIAERHDALIVSADSRQIYRGFDIGTAKPTAAERALVRHEGIDLADPTQRWSAARWARDAAAWIDVAAREGRAVVVVGGTGLWLQALVRPLADEPKMDAAERAQLRRELAAVPTSALRARVEVLDPARAHLGRTQLLRAIEVTLLTGARMSELHLHGSAHAPRPARWLVVDPGAALPAQLDARRAEMLANGWLAEVESLAARVPDDAPAWNACGYREVRSVVRVELALDDAVDQVRIRTRQYAKRQRTWFRNQLEDVGPVARLDPNEARAALRADHWFTHGVLA